MSPESQNKNAKLTPTTNAATTASQGKKASTTAIEVFINLVDAFTFVCMFTGTINFLQSLVRLSHPYIYKRNDEVSEAEQEKANLALEAQLKKDAVPFAELVLMIAACCILTSCLSRKTSLSKIILSCYALTLVLCFILRAVKLIQCCNSTKYDVVQSDFEDSQGQTVTQFYTDLHTCGIPNQRLKEGSRIRYGHFRMILLRILNFANYIVGTIRSILLNLKAKLLTFFAKLYEFVATKLGVDKELISTNCELLSLHAQKANLESEIISLSSSSAVLLHTAVKNFNTADLTDNQKQELTYIKVRQKEKNNKQFQIDCVKMKLALRKNKKNPNELLEIIDRLERLNNSTILTDSTIGFLSGAVNEDEMNNNLMRATGAFQNPASSSMKHILQRIFLNNCFIDILNKNLQGLDELKNKKEIDEKLYLEYTKKLKQKIETLVHDLEFAILSIPPQDEAQEISPLKQDIKSKKTLCDENIYSNDAELSSHPLFDFITHQAVINNSVTPLQSINYLQKIIFERIYELTPIFAHQGVEHFSNEDNSAKAQAIIFDTISALGLIKDSIKLCSVALRSSTHKDVDYIESIRFLRYAAESINERIYKFVALLHLTSKGTISNKDKELEKQLDQMYEDQSFNNSEAKLLRKSFFKDTTSLELQDDDFISRNLDNMNRYFDLINESILKNVDSLHKRCNELPNNQPLSIGQLEYYQNSNIKESKVSNMGDIVESLQRSDAKLSSIRGDKPTGITTSPFLVTITLPDSVLEPSRR